MGGEWFCLIADREIGPLLPRQLKAMAASGQILPTDHVRPGRTGSWVLASRVKGLFAKPEQPVLEEDAREATQSQDMPKSSHAEDELAFRDEGDSSEYALPDIIPLRPAPTAPPLPSADDSEEYTFAPLPDETTPKTLPTSDLVPTHEAPPAPKKHHTRPPTPPQRNIGAADPLLDVGSLLSPRLSDSGMERLAAESLSDAGSGVPIHSPHARRQRQQQQRLLISLAVIGVGVALALFVFVVTRGGGKESPPAGQGRPANKAKDNLTKPANQIPAPRAPADTAAAKGEGDKSAGAANDKVAPGKASARAEDEPLPPPTGTPESDFGIKASDEVPDNPLPKAQP